MKQVIMLCFILSCGQLLAQKQGNIWYFGDQAGLDFNTDPPTALLGGQTDFHPPLQWNEGCTSISDSSGTLLFYSNGEKVWNTLQQVMPNGDGLLGHSSSTSSSIIVPQPNSDRYFYLFTIDAWENSFQNGLRYSIIDMCLDNGYGDVLIDQKNIPLYDNAAEKLCAVQHSNGGDYWIVTHENNTDAFVSFRLTSAGMTDTIVSNTGTSDPQGWGGQMVASPNGDNIAYAIPNAQSFGKAMLLDFDATTGILSNEQILATGGREWGVSFSQDNSKLYFSTAGFGELFQYDLNAGDLDAVIASKTYLIQNGPDSWRHHRLGPDGRIYISRAAKDYISRIEFPDVAGIDCNYVDSAIYLGGQQTSFGLPDLVTGYHYNNATSQCETAVDEHAAYLDCNIYPNPTNEHTTLEFDNLRQEKHTLTLYNAQGRPVRIIPNIRASRLRIDTEGLYGLYFFQLRNERQVRCSGKLMVE